MKKIISFILCLVILVLSLSACGKNEPADNLNENDTIIENPVTENNDEKVENTPDVDNSIAEKEEVTEDKKPSSDSVKPPVKDEKPVKTEISLSELASSMVGVIPADQHNLELMPEELYKDIYGVDKSQFADCVIYGTMISVKANEIILIKVNDESDINKAKEILENRKNQVYKTWEQYLPDQFEMVKSGVIKTQGKYATLIITPDVNKVSSKFSELAK